MKKLDQGSINNLIFIGKWILFVMLPIAVGNIILQKVGYDGLIGNWMINEPKVYCSIIWILYAVVSARFEAHYYEHEINSKFTDNFNEHKLLTFARLLVVTPLSIIASWKAGICLMFMFPFFHDGQYYTTRNLLNRNIYKRKWFDQSRTSTAILTKIFTPVVRIICAVAGIAGLIFLK